MRIPFLVCIFLILWVQAAKAESIITVDVLESGDALWTVEKRESIITQVDIDNWEEFIQKGSRYRHEQDIADFKESIDWLIGPAENFSDRSMKIENFNVSYDTGKTMSGTVGIVRYSFEWKNFLHTDSAKIYIGDAFPEGMVLSTDNTLIIRIPPGYEIQNATPGFDKRDGNRLIWEGTLHPNFSKGEPALVLSRTAAVSSTKIIWGKILWPFIAVFAVLLISVTSIILLKRRHSRNLTAGKTGFYEDLKHVPAEFQELLKIPGIWHKIIQFMHKELGIKSVEELEKAAREHRLRSYTNGVNGEPEDAGSENALTPLPEMTNEILGYEEMIEQYLQKSSGQAYQSDIVKHSGLSKSKISIVLADMKEKGRIIKIRKGKENIIRLASR